MNNSFTAVTERSLHITAMAQYWVPIPRWGQGTPRRRSPGGGGGCGGCGGRHHTGTRGGQQPGGPARPALARHRPHHPRRHRAQGRGQGRGRGQGAVMPTLPCRCWCWCWCGATAARPQRHSDHLTERSQQPLASSPDPGTGHWALPGRAT